MKMGRFYFSKWKATYWYETKVEPNSVWKWAKSFKGYRQVQTQKFQRWGIWEEMRSRLKGRWKVFGKRLKPLFEVTMNLTLPPLPLFLSPKTPSFSRPRYQSCCVDNYLARRLFSLRPAPFSSSRTFAFLTPLRLTRVPHQPSLNRWKSFFFFFWTFIFDTFPPINLFSYSLLEQ